MNQYIAHVTLVVRDYDEAIAFYTKMLDFDLIENTILDDGKRWVLVKPKGPTSCCILLAKAKGEVQEAAIGNQTGGRVFLFLYTNNFWTDYNTMVSRGIHFVRKPQENDYGLVAVFKDLYGNLWDLLQPFKRTSAPSYQALSQKIEDETDHIWKDRNLTQKGLDNALLSHKRTKY